MPKLMGLPVDQVGQTASGVQYSNVSVDRIGATECTIVHIVVDKTGSVAGYKTDLEKMLAMSLDACKKSPRVNNLVARTTAFNADYNRIDIEEIHGFTPLSLIDTTKFAGTINPTGGTPLFDATFDAIDATFDYGKKLYDKQILSNAIIFIITDGENNVTDKVSDPKQIKDLLAKYRKNEILESIRTILIGVNETDPLIKDCLEKFKDEAGLDDFVWVGQATPGKLAKLAQFVSQSTSSQSQALGTGGVSQPVSFTF